jgi:multiple sugar transport system permease protein
MSGSNARRSRFHLSDGSFGFLIVLPALILMLVFFIYPMLFSAYTSFQNYNIAHPDQTTFAGLGNYVKTLGSPDFQRALGNTVVYVSIALPVEFGLGLILALALATVTRGRNWLRTLLIIPMMLAPVAMALMWKFMYNDELGIINHLLRSLGSNRPPLWLTDPGIALFSVILVEVWATVPVFILLLLAGLLAIPQDYYEAATIDGAGALAAFRYVTLPLLRPVILVGLLIRGMDAFRVFDLIFVLTKGGPALRTDVLSFYVYRVAFTNRAFGEATAAAWIMAIILLVAGLILIRLMRRSGSVV